MITVGILSLLAFVIIVGWVISRRRHRATRRTDELPLFTVPLGSGPVVARPTTPSQRARDEVYAQSYAEPTSSTNERSFAPRAATIRTRDGATSTLARGVRDDRDDSPVSVSADDLGDAVDGAAVRYWRPADGTLQFLPGRLEIAAGRDAGQEIRFVRTAGPDGTCVTFGRAEGPPYRHVQLREPTVSRAHARMVLETSLSPNDASRGTTTANPGRWRLENLSSTNPVVVNGRALESGGAPLASMLLSDGDRIEMGEVAFVFHER